MQQQFVGPPVVLAQPIQVQRALRHKKSLLGIGITQLLIAVFCIGVGSYEYAVLAASSYGYSAQRNALTIISGGIWFLVSGSLAIASSTRPTSCNVIAGIVIGILASLAAFGLTILGGVSVFGLISLCNQTYCANFGAGMALSAIFTLACLVEFILSIVHASFCCGCCGHQDQPATVTMTTTALPVIHAPGGMGKGYVRLEAEGTDASNVYASSKAPMDAPPLYKA